MRRRVYNQRVAHPSGSKTIIEERIVEEVEGGTWRSVSSERGELETRPTTPEEDQWEADQLAEEAARDTEAAALARLDLAADVLRYWASGAEAVVAEWDGATQEQKDAWMKTTVERLGKLTDNLADLLIQVGVRRDI